MDLKAIANKTIPARDGKTVLTKPGTTTAGIIAEVKEAFRDCRGDLKNFAPHLKAATLKQTLYNVWRFWKGSIRYKVDPTGKQLVKEPAALWALKSGDCKSLSVAVMCTLDSLGIKAAFRFTSYNGNTLFPTHVYVVVKDKGELIPVDCVWKKFGEEKTPYSKKWDYNMPTDVYRVSGFDDAPQVGRFSFGLPRNAAQQVFALNVKAGQPQKGAVPAGILRIKAARKKHHQCRCHMPKRGELFLPNKDITDNQLYVLQKKQELELAQKNHQINGGIGAIGDSIDNAYEIQITGLHNAVAPYMGWARKRIVGFKSPKHPNYREHTICGISATNMLVTDGTGESEAMDATQANYVADAIGSFFGSIWKGIKSVGKAIGKGAAAVGKGVFKGVKAVGKGIVKVVKAPINLIGKGVKAVGKLIGKVVTAPARKAILNDLPGYGPFFLYTFITDPKLLAKLPPIVKTKRDKAMYYRNLLTGKLQISAANFDSAVRNGIMQQLQNTPEAVIQQWITDTNFQIGFLGAILGAAAGLLGKGIKAIVGDTGENLPTDAEQYAPAVEDWGALTQDARIRLGLEAAPAAPITTPELYNQVNSGQYQQQQYQQAYIPPAATQPYQAPASNYDFSGGGTTGNDYGLTSANNANVTDYPDAGSALANEKELPDVELTRYKARPAESSIGGSGLAIAAIAAIALLAASKKKRRA